MSFWSSWMLWSVPAVILESSSRACSICCLLTLNLTMDSLLDAEVVLRPGFLVSSRPPERGVSLRVAVWSVLPEPLSCLIRIKRALAGVPEVGILLEIQAVGVTDGLAVLENISGGN